MLSKEWERKGESQSNWFIWYNKTSQKQLKKAGAAFETSSKTTSGHHVFKDILHHHHFSFSSVEKTAAVFFVWLCLAPCSWSAIFMNHKSTLFLIFLQSHHIYNNVSVIFCGPTLVWKLTLKRIGTLMKRKDKDEGVWSEGFKNV